MSVDAKCYEAISGAGLEPILQGGRGQASGFIMRMMAENKKKHQGQYKNPSDNNYGSTMNQFRPFNYKALANRDQNGRNTSDYGASPFIIKHFGSPQSVPYIPKAQRGSEEHRVIEGETDEQKSARLQAKAEELAEKAKELLEQAKQKGKVKEFLKGRVAIKRAKAVLQDKKIDRDYERKRKAQEDFEKDAIAYSPEVRKEWSKVDKAIGDFLRYRYKGETGEYSRRSKMRELFKEFYERKMTERFPDFKKRFGKIFSYNTQQRIIPTTAYDGVSYPYNYKHLTFAEAKKVYDEVFPPEGEETAEEKAERTRGLKGVVRRILRTKQNLKAQAQKLPLPSWWDGVMCVLDWAEKAKEVERFFGKTLQHAYRALNKPQVKRLAELYMKWVFTTALPTKGYDLTEIKPTEETFPQVEQTRTESVNTPNGGVKHTYYRTGVFKPSGTRMMLGRDTQGYHPERDSPLPLPPTMTLLIHPNGKLAWLISIKQGEERWVGLANMAINNTTAGNTGFSFSTKFKKVGDKWVHIVGAPVNGADAGSYRPKYDPIKVGDITLKEPNNDQTLLGSNPPKEGNRGGYDRNVEWAYPEGIAEITKSLFDDLCKRKAWSGKSLADIDLGEAPPPPPPPPPPAPVKRKIVIKKPAPAPAQTAKPQAGATYEAVRAYINTLAGANKLERAVAMYRNLNMGKSEREIAKDTGVSQPSVNRWKTKFATD
jgi:hypothetical protein